MCDLHRLIRDLLFLIFLAIRQNISFIKYIYLLYNFYEKCRFPDLYKIKNNIKVPTYV